MPLSPTPVDAETGAPTPAVDPTVVHFPVHNATVEFPASMSLDEVQQAASKIHEQFNQGAGALSQGLGGPATADEAEQMVSNTPAGFIHPFDSLKTAVSGIVGSANNADLLDKAKSAWNSGDKITAARHFTNALIPFIGQNSDKAGDELVNGSFGKAVGHTLAAIAPFFLGRESSPAETAETAETGAKTEAAASAAKRPTNDIPNRSSEMNPNASLGDARNIVQRRIAQAEADAKPAAKVAKQGTQTPIGKRLPTTAMTAAERAATAYIRKQYAGDTAAVDLLGHQETESSLSEAKHGTEMQHEQASASNEEVNQAAEAEAKKLSERPSFEYSKDRGDLLNTHRVNVSSDSGPNGYITATEPTGSKVWTLDKAEISPAGTGAGTQAYTRLAQEAQRQGAELRSGSVVSKPAQRVWQKLRDSGLNVIEEQGKGGTAYRIPAKKTSVSIDVLPDWENAAQQELGGKQ